MAASASTISFDESTPLRILFSDAVRIYNVVEDSDSTRVMSDATVQVEIRSALAAFSECARRVDSLALFSTNEFVEDVATADLRFILVDAYLGELTLKLVEEDRLSVLNTSEKHLKAYLERLDGLGLLNELDKKLMKLEMGILVLSADARRQEKISQFKREKATRNRLKELSDLLALKSDVSDQDNDDDDTEREWILTTISLIAQKSIGSLRMIKEERPMVEEMIRRKNEIKNVESSAEDRIETAGARRLAQLDGPLLDRSGRPLRPFVVTSGRERVQQGVFRAGHNLPTMTIDEYLQREVERGNVLSGGTERPEKKDPADEDEVGLEAARIKAINWDEFRDENPRGWGNRHNKG